MKKLQLSLCAVGVYIVLVVAFALFDSHPATSQGKGLPPGPNVRVVNTASEPVPVTGKVHVASLPAVQLDTNGPLPVRDVDYAARKPVTTDLNLGSGGHGSVYTIPDKQRLVIEFISISAPGNTSAGLGIWDAGLTGYSSQIRFPLSNGVYAGAVKIYVEPGTAGFGTGTALRFFTDGPDTGNITLSGYLEPIP